MKEYFSSIFSLVLIGLFVSACGQSEAISEPPRSALCQIGETSCGSGGGTSDTARTTVLLVDLTAMPINDTQIRLDWTVQQGVDLQFYLERRLDPQTAFAPINNTAMTALTYTDTGLIPGRTYQYRIRARVGSGSDLTGYASTQPSAQTCPNAGQVYSSTSSRCETRGPDSLNCGIWDACSRDGVQLNDYLTALRVDERETADSQFYYVEARCSGDTFFCWLRWDKVQGKPDLCSKRKNASNYAACVATLTGSSTGAPGIPAGLQPFPSTLTNPPTAPW